MNIVEAKTELGRILADSCDGRVSRKTAYAALDALEKGHRAALAEKDKQIAILELKNRSSLANNLCPDHRDKQSGKPCLACEIEKKDAEVARLGGD